MHVIAADPELLLPKFNKLDYNLSAWKRRFSMPQPQAEVMKMQLLKHEMDPSI